ncbi:MAG: hypothetical protein RLZZ142_846 [Verrucomicrobiota bacterium]|jgi:predicted nucleotide-binding protein
MKSPTLIDCFRGEAGRRLRIECLMRQWLLRGDESLAAYFAEVGELQELAAGDILIRQGEAETDVYFILTGRLRVLVDQQEVALRGAGQHVGEMALIDPGLPRTATTIAAEPTVVSKIPEALFAPLANANPRIWRALGAELSRRLNQQGSFLGTPNRLPHLLIRASHESLPYAEALAARIPAEAATARVCSREFFQSECLPIEDLESHLRVADLAALVVPEDERLLRRNAADSGALRDRIVFEVGLLMGALSRHRTLLLLPEGCTLEIPLALLGITPLLYHPTVGTADAAILDAAHEIQHILAYVGPR